MKRIKEDITNHIFHTSYLLYGEEDYLVKMYRDKIKKAVLADSDEMNYSYFEGKDIPANEVRSIGETLPFFSDYRVLLIENSGWFKSASEMADYMADFPESTIFVFVEKEIDKRNKLYKYVNKNGLAVEMSAMTTREMNAWIAMILKQNHRVMRQQTAQYLLERIDNSMLNVQNEMDKLVAYTEGREEITVEDIDAVCCVQITGRIFQMMDAVAGKRKEETIRLYHDLLTLRESPMSILYLLTRHFNILLQVKDLASRDGKDVIAKKVGVPPFTVGKYQAQCRQFTLGQLKYMLNQCVDTEYQFKRGNLSDQLGIEILLVSFVS